MVSASSSSTDVDRGLDAKRSSSVLMVGTDMRTRGGIATVVRGYELAGLFHHMPVRYVVTHVDGGWLRKAIVAAGAYARVVVALIVMRQPLVHVHLSSRASFWRKSVICELAIACRRPYLLHVHGSEFMEFYQRESSSVGRAYIRRILRRAGLLLALSEQWSARLRTIEPRAAVQILPNAVSLPEAPMGAARNVARPSVLFAGRIGQRKGTWDLLNAFVDIAARFPEARLVCAGDGDVDAAINRASQLGLSGRVSFPGWLSPTAMENELKSASLFVLPSYAEGLPMALLEAMSFGIPVVATPVGGIPQVIVNKANGVLVQPGDVAGLTDAVAALLGDEPLARQIGTAARETIAQSYSLERAVEHLTAIYRRYGVRPHVGK